MIKQYLNFVSLTKSQITIFVLLNICGLIFFLLPHNIFWNMLDLEPYYNEAKVIYSFNAIGPDGRSIYLLSALILDTFFPILYTSLILGAYIKLFKNSNILLFLPIIAMSFDILENFQIMRLNLNFPNINETHVYLSSVTTSAKWIAITMTIVVLSYGIIKKRLKY